MTQDEQKKKEEDILDIETTTRMSRLPKSFDYLGSHGCASSSLTHTNPSLILLPFLYHYSPIVQACSMPPCLILLIYLLFGPNPNPYLIARLQYRAYVQKAGPSPHLPSPPLPAR